MNLKKPVIRLIPVRYNIPARFYYRKIMGQLEKEFYILERLIGSRDVAIDVGANLGFYSFALSRLCKRVEYFEPNPECAELIKKYGAKSININTVGLSSAEGVLKLSIPVIHGKPMTEQASFNVCDGEHRVLEVLVRTLDSYNFKRVSFIKIDVEGHEIEVLKGAQETVLREKPVILVEIEQRHLSFPMQDVFEKFSGLGYNGFFLMEGQICPLSAFSFETHQQPDKIYINNFIFIHKKTENPFIKRACRA